MLVPTVTWRTLQEVCKQYTESEAGTGCAIAACDFMGKLPMLANLRQMGLHSEFSDKKGREK